MLSYLHVFYSGLQKEIVGFYKKTLPLFKQSSNDIQ